jgi:hypothetical protein
MGVCCAILGELFSPFPQDDAARMAVMSVAFTAPAHLQALTEQGRFPLRINYFPRPACARAASFGVGEL